MNTTEQNKGLTVEPSVQANRQHKSSVFALLFSKPEILRELYSAIEGVDLSPDITVDINTISGVLVKGMRNDISFLIDNRLVILLEHQSSLSANLPLKVFKYIEKVYDKIINYGKIHNRQLIKIPKPEFIVLYNGKETYPEYKELRLSDAFMDKEGLGKSRESLELVVQVYNINHGQNQEIQRRCETLNDYSLFIEKIREYEKTGLSLDKSVEYAIKYCLEHNILQEFLREHGSQVVSMMVHEYTTEDFIEAIREEAFEEGIGIGTTKGIVIGTEKGIGIGNEERENLRSEIADKDAILAVKDAQLADQAAEITRLLEQIGGRG
jgi:hypothetical protein